VSVDLERFVEAQAHMHGAALRELQDGRKRSHWMWFVFPQLEGLGTSAMAQRFAIADVEEARAYLAHDVLGPRLVACCEALLGHAGRSATDILGTPDDLKLRSSMTLFAVAARGAGPAVAYGVFARVLEAFFDGRPDPATLRLLD
jgi:uncharacterized protein (DUF1810 family)